LKKLSSLLVSFALVLVSCGGSNEVVATVNGVDVTVGDVEALIDRGDESTIAKEEFAQVLTFKIVYNIMTRDAEDEFGITFSDEEIAAEADGIMVTGLPQGQTREAFLEERRVTEQYLQEVAQQSLVFAAVVEAMAADLEPPTQEQIDTQMARSVTEVCAAHILVGTEEEADEVAARLADGEEFAALAAELSLDGSGAQGGELGCQPASGYVPEFAAAAMIAELGVATDPVQTEFGFHILLISQRTEAPPEEWPTEDQIMEFLLNQVAGPASGEWFTEKAAAAEVEVNEKYGTWQTEPTPEVVPPTE